VLGDTPPPAFTQWEYLVVPLASAALPAVADPLFARPPSAPVVGIPSLDRG
jgi:hypothetical protein